MIIPPPRPLPRPICRCWCNGASQTTWPWTVRYKIARSPGTFCREGVQFRLIWALADKIVGIIGQDPPFNHFELKDYGPNDFLPWHWVGSLSTHDVLSKSQRLPRSPPQHCPRRMARMAQAIMGSSGKSPR